MEMNDDDLHHYSPSRRFCALSWLIVDSCRLLMISPCCVLQKDAFCCVFTQFMAHFPSYPCPSNHKGCILVRREEKGGKSRPQGFFSLLALKHFTNDPANRQGHKHIQNPLKHVGPSPYGSISTCNDFQKLLNSLAMTSRRFFRSFNWYPVLMVVVSCFCPSEISTRSFFTSSNWYSSGTRFLWLLCPASVPQTFQPEVSSQAPTGTQLVPSSYGCFLLLLFLRHFNQQFFRHFNWYPALMVVLYCFCS